MPKAPRFYSTREVAEILGISVQRVKQLRKDRHLGTLIGKTLVFTEAEVNNMRTRRPRAGRPSKNERESKVDRDVR